MRVNPFASWQSGPFGKALKVLPKSDQRKMFYVVFIQIFLGLLDLIGVVLIGVIGALTVTGIESAEASPRINQLMNFLHLQDFSFQQQAAILGAISCTVFISRTVFSVIFNRRILFFLSRRGAVISTEIVSRVLALPLISLQQRTSQNYVFGITNGVNAITLGIIGSSVILIADLSLLVVLTVGLFMVNPIVALSSLAIFGFVGLLVFKLIHIRVRELGKFESSLTIETNSKIIEVLSSYRESVVRNRRGYYAREIGKLRWSMADTAAELTFIPNISKYVIEATLVISVLLISALEFSIQDARHSIASLAIFIAAGSRIAPAVLRIQQGALQVRSNLGIASSTIELLDDLLDTQKLQAASDDIEINHGEFVGEVVLDKVSLTYPEKSRNALSDVSLRISPGESLAIVGASGAGKTSLVDVILGIIEPSSGTVTISGNNPEDAISRWAGAIGYVPQDVVIIDGTIKENVCLGFSIENIPDALVQDALKDAQLQEFVASLTYGMESRVGERGSKISGGQRQRLGIARALLTKPKLLILDEATSALDAETESNISDVLSKLQNKVTVIMIAHRLTTVRKSNRVVYMEDGGIIAEGSFDEVRSKVPNFDKHAKLLEL
jgi:ATP-binding cassette, subfamily B, bacterial PglK